jgi:hypothetical protein
MNLATFVVEGDAVAVKSAAKTLALSPDRQWREGEATRSGRARNSNGFSATIADTSSPGGLIDEVTSFIDRCVELGLDFRSLGLSATISVGISVGDSSQFFASVAFPFAVLQSMVKSGVALDVTAYPTSDEANAT